MDKYEGEKIIQLLNESTKAAIELIDERDYLKKIACIDPLTGLNNRYALDRVRDFTGIMMIDIDDFKSINDTYGHGVGDQVLRKIAELIKKSTRAKDCICRYGGDEFVAVFIECPQEVIRERAKLIGASIRENVTLGSNPVRHVTTSIGYAFNDRNESFESVKERADIALYESKEKGKDTVSEFVSKLPIVINEPEGISFRR